MNDDASGPSTRRRTASFRRRLNLPSRIRGRLREFADRVLGADFVWSLALVIGVVAILGFQRCGAPPETFHLGEIAPREVKARYDFELEDVTRTEERRAAEAATVPEAYVRDGARGARLVAQLTAVFDQGRRALTEEVAGPDVVMPSRIPQRARDFLIQAGFARSLEETLTRQLERVMGGSIVGNRALLDDAEEISIVYAPEARVERIRDLAGIIDIDTARDRVRQSVREALDLRPQDETVLADLAALYVDANLAYDHESTRRAREQASAAIPPSMMAFSRGAVLVQEGHRIDAQTLAKLDAHRDAGQGRLDVTGFLGLFLIVAMLAFFLYRYATFHQRDFKRIPHLHALLVMVCLLSLALSVGLMWIVGQVVEDRAAPFGDVELYRYLVPIGAGSVLVTLLATARVAMVYSVFSAILFGAVHGWSFFAMLWAALAQYAGIYAIATYRDRAALLRAGLVIGTLGAVYVVAIEALRGTLEPWSTAMYGATLAFLGGAVGVGLVVSFALPPLEGLFRVLTEIRLLELSNIDHPLLSQLAFKAPGSYNHSLVVGSLAEEGAKAIGANSLFCRVAAFYHDIGKIVKPEYFVENQSGVNPHDKLSPSMSALVIAAHVKDGIRLAREAGLPEQIVDIIPQHHGTRLMTYFHEKAKSAADPTHGEIKDADFRYPGPKPQSREAAIFMLCDAVEAAARTIDDPTPNRLREVIRKVSSVIVLDGQFDECDLTFADLDRIESALLRALVSMYHHRVEYPGFDFGKEAAERDRAVPEDAPPMSSGDDREGDAPAPVVRIR